MVVRRAGGAVVRVRFAASRLSNDITMNTKQDPIHKKCVPCEGGTKPMEYPEIDTYKSYLSTPWEIIDDLKLKQQFTFKDFKQALVFVNKVATIAEEEGHHPDITIVYNKVTIELTTHAIKGLSVNDFIMARKIEEINV